MIWCVEDDQAIRDLMIYTLNVSGFEARGFTNGEEMLKALDGERPEMILLDIMLPGEDGISILKRLKGSAVTRDIPVVIASAKGTEFDKVIGLDLGADDYLAKPFGMMEMISRVRAVLRRVAPKNEADVLRAGRLEMNRTDHTVTADGVRISLTVKEYDLLEKFMEYPGRAFTRDGLLAEVWGLDFIGETRTVDVHIGTLRGKLLSCRDYIETVRGVGYRLEVKP